MHKIVVIGNSIAGMKAVEALQATGEEIEVTVFSAEEALPYNRRLLLDWVARRTSRNKVFYRPLDDYKARKINFILDKKVSRVNFKRGRVSIDDKQQFDYDLMFITALDAKPLATVKGSHRAGLFHCKRFLDIEAFLKIWPLTDTVAVSSQSVFGLELACSLLDSNREVIFVTSERHILSSFLDAESAAVLQNLAEQAGLRVITGNPITEFLGDSEIKAIRLQNGKVIGCQAVLSDEAKPDLRLFKDSDLQCGEAIVVNERFQTNIANVFAMDMASDAADAGQWDASRQHFSYLEQQGRIVAGSLLGTDDKTPWPRRTWSLQINDHAVVMAENDGTITLDVSAMDSAVKESVGSV